MSEQNDQMKKRLAELRTIRDQIRVDLHLAGMDLKDEWKLLERKLPDPEAAFDQLKEATAEAIEALTADLRRFRDRLQRKPGCSRSLRRRPGRRICLPARPGRANLRR